MNLNDIPPVLIPAEFEQCLARQRAAYLADPVPSRAQRVADLKALARLLKDNRDALVDAINRDYGNRSSFETMFAEYLVVLDGIRDTIKHLKGWMKPLKRHVDAMMYLLARNRVIAQPQPMVVRPRPVYLYVPPGHQKHWAKHCSRYGACGQPVYFVQERWVRERYEEQQRGHGAGHGKKKHKD